MTWGTVWEAARPPVGGRHEPSPPRMHLCAVASPDTPPHPQPKPGPPSEAVRDHKLAFRFTSWKLNTNPSCYLNVCMRTRKDEHIFFPVSHRADSSGHVARVSINCETSPHLGKTHNNFTSFSIWPSAAPNVLMRSQGAQSLGFLQGVEISGNASRRL